MKRQLLILVILALSALQLLAQTEGRMIVHMMDGSRSEVELSKVDFIDFTTPDDGVHEGVDLGLSVVWAAYNVGAAAPEQYGEFFAWGETAQKSNYGEEYYSYFNNQQYQYIGRNITGTRYDAARSNWGAPWRMPTLTEVRELQQQCQWEKTTVNGVTGYRVTGPNGRSIFLPAAGYQPADKREQAGTEGYYWTSIVNSDMPSSAYTLNFRGYSDDWSASRAYGFSVRAVRAK